MSNIEERLKTCKNIKVINYRNYDEPYIYDDASQDYFSCVDAMEDWYKDNDLEMPRYAYGVYFVPIQLDLDYILENACEEHHEDTLYSLDCVEELREAIDKFNKDNETTGSYFDDINTIVELF